MQACRKDTSKVMVQGHDNPQTGPLYVDGAGSGDTLAIHIDKLEPANAMGLSAFFRGFGALNGTDRTAMLGAIDPACVCPAVGAARVQPESMPDRRPGNPQPKCCSFRNAAADISPGT